MEESLEESFEDSEKNHLESLEESLRRIPWKDSHKNPWTNPLEETLEESLETLKPKNDGDPRSTKQGKNEAKQQVFFCIGACPTWRGKNSIHMLVKRLKNKYNLKWIRISMSYHRFGNLNDIFSGDLSEKMMKNIGSNHFSIIIITNFISFPSMAEGAFDDQLT